MPDSFWGADTVPVDGGAPSSFWDDDAIPAEPDATQSPVTAATTGLMQGGTLGFADEIGAVGKTAMNALTGITGPLAGQDLSSIGEDYGRTRNQLRSEFAQAAEANPKTALAANIAGAVASPLSTLGPQVASGRGLGAAVANAGAQGATQGAVMGLGNSEADTIGGMARDVAIGTGMGTVGGMAGGALAHGAAKVAAPLSRAFTGAADAIDDKAGLLAENATGATAAQSEKFAPGAGRELLDRGLVRPFDTATKVAERTAGAVDDAAKAIDDSLRALEAQGVTASADNVVAVLEKRIAAIEGDASQAGTVRKLRNVVEDIIATGKSDLSLTAAENTKRGFRKAAGNWTDPDAGQAGKEAYRAYMSEVERAATEANPALAGKFKEAKKTTGLLTPIQEAAQKRSAQMNQNPLGGLGDTAAAGAGAILGTGAPGAAAGVAAKRFAAPRLASTAAWGMDRIGDVVRATPQAFGRFAAPLQAAAQRGGQALAATHFILQQTNEQYRQMIRELQDKGAQETNEEDRVLAGH